MESGKLEQQTPDGAILSIDSSIADPPPKLDAEQPEPKPANGAHMTPKKMMLMLKKMVQSEQLTPEQARQMRRQFGISQAFFTGPKVSEQEKKKKRKIADASRRANRYNGSAKGQKRTHGR